jgi:hypothetical protein
MQDEGVNPQTRNKPKGWCGASLENREGGISRLELHRCKSMAALPGVISAWTLPSLGIESRWPMLACSAVNTEAERCLVPIFIATRLDRHAAALDP